MSTVCWVLFGLCLAIFLVQAVPIAPVFFGRPRLRIPGRRLAALNETPNPLYPRLWALAKTVLFAIFPVVSLNPLLEADQDVIVDAIGLVAVAIALIVYTRLLPPKPAPTEWPYQN